MTTPDALRAKTATHYDASVRTGPSPVKPAGFLTDPALEAQGVPFGFKYWALVAFFLAFCFIATSLSYSNSVERGVEREFALRVAYQYYSSACVKDCVFVENYSFVRFYAHNFNPTTAGEYAIEGNVSTARQWLDFTGGACKGAALRGHDVDCPVVIDARDAGNVSWTVTLVDDWSRVG